MLFLLFFRTMETLSCLLELKNCIKRTTYENEITLDYITLNDNDKFKNILIRTWEILFEIQSIYIADLPGSERYD